MKTGRLIEILSTNVEPVQREQIMRAFAWALAVGEIFALALMYTTIGLRPNLFDGANLCFLALKLSFALSLIGIGVAFLIALTRPGQGIRLPFGFIFIPFGAIILAGLAALVLRGFAAWGGAIMGTEWATCLICIPLFAIIPFAALIWALRKGSPTNLKRSGAMAGLVAGALGAAAYAFHCPDDSLPFIAVWYCGSLAFLSFVGAMLGPSLLRW